MGQEEFLHLYLALEIAQVEQSQGDVVVLELDLEVEQRILVVNLYYSGCGFAGIHPDALLYAQHIEGIYFSLRMPDDRASAVSTE